MTKINCKLKITGSILLFLFICNSFSLFSFPLTNNNLSKGESGENPEELKLSATYWTTTEVVSTESTGYSNEPTIAVDGAGNVHVAWNDWTNYGGSGTDSDIFYKRWNGTSSTWTTTEVVSTESTGDSYDPTIVVDGAGNAHVAWYDGTNYEGSGTDFDIFYKRWNATSNTWTTTEVVSTESTDISYRSTIAVDGAGNAHVAWHDLTDYGGSGADLDIFYKRWNATSSTWATTEVVSTESTSESSFPMIAVDGAGNAHVAWYDFTDYSGSGTDRDIFYKHWNVTSSTWTTTEVVSTESTDELWGFKITVDGAGNVYVAWGDSTNYGGSGTDYDIYYKQWNAISRMWTTAEVVSTESTGHSYSPTIVVDGAGNVYVAWTDFTDYSGSGTDLDIFYKHWNVTSSTWTTTEVVSTESTDNSDDPMIAVDGAGNLHVTWRDKTNYSSSGTDYDIFYKRLNPTPEIIIYTPDQNDVYGTVAPNFNISVTLSNLDTMWYTLDGGITNITLSQLTGTIDQTEWDNKEYGLVTIGFYANYTIDFEVYAEVTVKKMPIPSIISPENKTYTVPMKGYYPATYGFENDIDGTSPEGWQNQDASSCTSQIISELGGHNKVLRQTDNNNGFAAVLKNTFTSTKDHGTIEFYVRTSTMTGGAKMSWWLWSASGYEIWLVMGDSKLSYFDGATWYDIIPSGLTANTWYHLSVRWRNTGTLEYEGLDEGEWKIFIDKVEYGNYALNHDNNMTNVNLETGPAPMGFDVYWDAIGFDWKNGYDIGDNLNEGLLLSFENISTLDWIGFSLDNQNNKTILGNTTIPFPSNGSHKVQVFGNDTFGTTCQSETRYFSVDTDPPEISITSPGINEFFGHIPPNFHIIILKPNITKMWYTLDNGLTNITFVELTGAINQTEWDKKGHGAVTIKFYANDSFGREGYAEVTVVKDIFAPSSSISFIPDKGINEVNISTTFILTADDGLGSGVSVIRYKINNSAWVVYTGPFNLSSYDYGYYLISYQAIDLVNNIETENTLLVRLVELSSEPNEPGIPGYNISLLIGITCVVSVILIKKRNKNK